MSDFIFVFFTIFAITTFIYLMYKLLLGPDKQNKEEELQITYPEMLAQIKLLYKERKYGIAENIAKKYIEKRPNDTGIRNILAKILYEQLEFYNAIEQAKIIIKQQPDDYSMYIFMANCYMKVGKEVKAIETLQDLLKFDIENVVAIKELADVYFSTNQKQSARKMYEKLDELLDNNQEKAKNKLKIAEIHIEFQEFDLAIKNYLEVLEIYPDDISVKKKLVILYQATSNYDSLITLANEILQVSNEQDKLWTLQQLMDVYNTMKDYEKALEYANLIREHQLSDEIESNENIAKILLEEGKIDSCIELLISLIAENPENIDIKKSLAKAYETKNDFDAAIDIYNNILDLVSANQVEKINFELSDIYAKKAMYLFSQKDNNGCFKAFTVALKYNDKNSDIYYNLGAVNREIKNFNEAVSQYKHAIELDPQNFNYHWAISLCYEEMDNIYEQKKALLECLKYNEEDPKVNYKLGIIYNLQNDPVKAMSYIKKAIELDSNFIEARHKLALMLEHSGNREEAIKVYESILRIEPENKEALNNLKMLKVG